LRESETLRRDEEIKEEIKFEPINDEEVQRPSH
jgi:hypothetical protein